MKKPERMVGLLVAFLGVVYAAALPSGTAIGGAPGDASILPPSLSTAATRGNP